MLGKSGKPLWPGRGKSSLFGLQNGSRMVPSLRKFIGMVALVLFVIVYALTAMVVGDSPRLQESSTLIQFTYFAIAGLAWVVPAGAIIWWMERGKKS